MSRLMQQNKGQENRAVKPDELAAGSGAIPAGSVGIWSKPFLLARSASSASSALEPLLLAEVLLLRSFFFEPPSSGVPGRVGAWISIEHQQGPCKLWLLCGQACSMRQATAFAVLSHMGLVALQAGVTGHGPCKGAHWGIWRCDIQCALLLRLFPSHS